MGEEHSGDASLVFPPELQGEAKGTSYNLQRTWVLPPSDFNEDSGPLEVPTLGCVFVHSHEPPARVSQLSEETSSPKMQREAKNSDPNKARVP